MKFKTINCSSSHKQAEEENKYTEIPCDDFLNNGMLSVFHPECLQWLQFCMWQTSRWSGSSNIGRSLRPALPAAVRLPRASA